MLYALAFIFIKGGIHQRVLLSFVHFTSDKGMDKGPGLSRHNHHHRDFHRYAPGARYIDLLSHRYYSQEKINCNNPSVADYLQYSVDVSLFILPNIFKWSAQFCGISRQSFFLASQPFSAAMRLLLRLSAIKYFRWKSYLDLAR
jgi:hypothetical protein